MRRRKRKPIPKCGVIIFRNRIYDSIEQAATLTGKTISQVQYAVYRKYKKHGDSAVCLMPCGESS